MNSNRNTASSFLEAKKITFKLYKITQFAKQNLIHRRAIVYKMLFVHMIMASVSSVFTVGIKPEDERVRL